jgi:uncharacterized membrane protein YgcG
VDTVLGVSMAPTTVRMVLVEGENADGVTVDEENFGVADGEDPATFSAPDQVVAAILGTREGADEAGYQLVSTGVTWTDQREAAVLRDVLTARKVENVMLVSAFLAAAALAQSMGSATGYARTALLYIEPDSATLAVVETTDGSIADVRRELLPEDDDQAVAALVELVSAAEALEEHPEGLLVVGSGVDVPLIRPALEAATSLPLRIPEQQDTALAKGAALASASAPLFASSTAALAYALDPGTGSVSQHALAPGYLAVAEAAAGVEPEADALAYSAVADDSAAAYTQEGPDGYADVEEEDFTTGMYPDFTMVALERPPRTPFFAAMSVMIIFTVGVVALVISLAFSIRPSVSSRPSLAQNVVAPRHVAAPAPQALVPVQPAPAPVPAPAAVAAPAPVRAAAPLPAPIRAPAPVPIPAPLIPLPAPAPPPLIPPILPRIFGPPLLGPPESPWGGDHGGGGWGHGDDGGGWGRGGGGWGHGGGGWGHGGFGGGHGHGRW